MPLPINWESIGQGLSRAKTPTGWLVREYQDVVHFNVKEHEHIINGYDWRVTLTHVPDPEHLWLRGPEGK